MEYKIQCPVCHGEGQIDAPKGRSLAESRKRAAHILRDAGFGIRETQRLLGLKSPRSVCVYLAKDE